MTEEVIQKYYNETDTLTAVCRTNSSWTRGEYPELKIGETYKVSHISVLRSSTNIMLKEFPGREYNSTCFDIYENGVSCDQSYTCDPRFWAPYLRKLYRMRNPRYIEEEIEEKAIPAHLKNVEKEFNVKVLLAVESGSRAWGFSSPDSDWDVRFIYVHKPEWYLKVEEQRDVIEHMYEDDVDLAGWELRKALRLFSRGNPSLFEWLHTPIVYYKDEHFVSRLMELEANYFNPIHSMYHYHRIYVKHDERYLQREGFPMKRFLYYLRGVLACRWIELHQTLPPVPFEELVAATIPEENIRKEVAHLLDLKRQSKEHDMMVVSPSLFTYAQELADYYRQHVDEYRPALLREDKRQELDRLLYDTVMIR